MNKREARAKAHELAAKAIREYVQNGRVELLCLDGDYRSVDKVETAMLSIADDLRERGQELEGDDSE